MAPQVVHYTFDAILISTVLAGIRRSTGLGCVGSVAPLEALQRSDAHVHLLVLPQRQGRQGRSRGSPLVPDILPRVSPSSLGPAVDSHKLTRSTYAPRFSIGEYVFDAAVVVLSRSSYFERKR